MLVGDGEKELNARRMLNFRRETVNIVTEPRVIDRPSLKTKRTTVGADRRLTAGLRVSAAVIPAVAAVILAGCGGVREPAPRLSHAVTIAGKDRGLVDG
jgi:hypothetical protein